MKNHNYIFRSVNFSTEKSSSESFTAFRTAFFKRVNSLPEKIPYTTLSILYPHLFYQSQKQD